MVLYAILFHARGFYGFLQMNFTDNKLSFSQSKFNYLVIHLACNSITIIHFLWHFDVFAVKFHGIGVDYALIFLSMQQCSVVIFDFPIHYIFFSILSSFSPIESTFAEAK